jgi:hypothetical protein
LVAKKINSLADILLDKAEHIDSSGVRDDISIIQEELDRNFMNAVKAESLQDDGTLIVRTKSSSMASEVRLKQHTIIQNLNKSLKNKLVRFRIKIG